MKRWRIGLSLETQVGVSAPEIKTLEGRLRFLEFRSLPGVIASGEIGNVVQTGAAKNAGGDRAAIAAFAMDDNKLRRVEFLSVLDKLTKWDADGAFDGSGFDLTRFANVEDGQVILFSFLQVAQLLCGDLRDVIELVTAFEPAGDAAFEVGVDVLDADASEAELGLAELVCIFADENDVAIETENACSPRGVLAGERDMQGARDVGGGEILRRARVEENGSLGLEAEDFRCRERFGSSELID